MKNCDVALSGTLVRAMARVPVSFLSPLPDSFLIGAFCPSRLSCMSTSMGDIKVELYPDKAPVTVKNFLDYVKAGYYNGTIFHRVIPGFMIQGGGLTADMQDKREGQKAPIKNESGNGLKNDTGTLAMARTNAP